MRFGRKLAKKLRRRLSTSALVVAASIHSNDPPFCFEVLAVAAHSLTCYKACCEIGHVRTFDVLSVRMQRRAHLKETQKK